MSKLEFFLDNVSIIDDYYTFVYNDMSIRLTPVRNSCGSIEGLAKFIVDENQTPFQITFNWFKSSYSNYLRDKKIEEICGNPS